MPTRADVLRALPSLTGRAPLFDPGTAPGAPGALFETWLQEAIDGGIAEPQAFVLSTAGTDGLPDARVLALKDLDPAGRWAFASSATSAKGRELAVAPVAAMTFWWQGHLRSVRIRGTVAPATPDESAADFLDRGLGARAVALSGTQSAPIADAAGLPSEIALALPLAEADLVEPAWQKWWLTATAVEFWQGDEDRVHVRLQYERDGGAWSRRRLRP